MALEFSERIQRIPTYPVAGGYAGHAPPVRLASNESPYPPLPAVREAIARALATLNRYPDPSNSLLRKRLSERYEVPPSRIAIGNGSCDILLAAGEALLEPGAELVYAGRQTWTEAAFQEHRTGAACASTLKALIAARAPLDLIGMATYWEIEERTTERLSAR